MKKIIIALLISCLSLSAFAADSKAKKKVQKVAHDVDNSAHNAVDTIRSSDANYGMAGCGLGTYVIKDNDKGQILAATTNGTGVQSSAITFGTSNCGENGKLVSANYIAANSESLKKDIARGSGETVQGLASVLQCPATRFESTLQSNYSKIFPQEGLTHEQVQQNIYHAIGTDQNLLATCRNLI